MRHIVHILISLAMWGLFGYYWYVVLGREIARTTIQALGILSIIIVAGLLITFWWVSHNMRLARRNRRTNPPPTRPETFTADFLGRPLVAPEVSLLQKAKVVDVEVLDIEDADQGEPTEKKIYSIAPEEVV